MLSDDQILTIADELLEEHNLKGEWLFEIVDDLDGNYGFTDVAEKHIKVSREYFPTYDRNVLELIRHEIAHAVCGHGRHNLEWWDTLIKIGGCGVWVNEWGSGTVQQARITDRT